VRADGDGAAAGDAVLIINKVDRAVIELKKSGEEIYQSFCHVIDMVNVRATPPKSP